MVLQDLYTGKQLCCKLLNRLQGESGSHGPGLGWVGLGLVGLTLILAIILPAFLILLWQIGIWHNQLGS